MYLFAVDRTWPRPSMQLPQRNVDPLSFKPDKPGREHGLRTCNASWKKGTSTPRRLHQVISQPGAWPHAAPCCGATREPAGLQLPSRSRTALLAPWVKSPCHTAHWQSRWEEFLFPVVIFFFIVVETLRESNTGGHSMPTATRNTSMEWKKADVYDFLLHFNCGMGTSQQAFNDMFQHL